MPMQSRLNVQVKKRSSRSCNSINDVRESKTAVSWSSPRRVKAVNDENCDVKLQSKNASPRKSINRSRNREASDVEVCSPAKQRATPKKRTPVPAVTDDENSPGNSPPTTPQSCKKAARDTLSSPLCKLALDSQQNVSVYQDVKRALHSSLPEVLLCRDEEIGEINTFITSNLNDNGPTSAASAIKCGSVSKSSLYISGAPGTGKTACLSEVIKTLKDGSKKKEFANLNAIISINCMSMKTPSAIYSNIALQLGLKGICDASDKDIIKQLERHFTKTSSKKILLVLDEMDQLSTATQHVLYTVFEWPTLQNSRLILIGLANALDLTDRILPKLEKYTSSKPQLLNFPPYNKSQIIEIIRNRLEQTSSPSCVAPSALTYVAMRVSAVSGDVRKALDLCRRALDLLDQPAQPAQTAPQPLTAISVTQCQNTPERKRSVGTVGSVCAAVKPVTMAVLKRVVESVDGDNLSQTVMTAQGSLPLAHKVLVCTLLLLAKDNRYGTKITLADLEKSYQAVCRTHGVTVERCQFVSTCQSLDAYSILSIGDDRVADVKARRVMLNKDEDELRYLLGEQKVLSKILSTGLPNKTS